MTMFDSLSSLEQDEEDLFLSAPIVGTVSSELIKIKTPRTKKLKKKAKRIKEVIESMRKINEREFESIARMLILHFNNNPLKKCKLKYKDIPIEVKKFYNTLGKDTPMKLSLFQKNYVFKQKMSMFPDKSCMNIFNLLNKHWKANKIDARIRTYKIFPLSFFVDLNKKSPVEEKIGNEVEIENYFSDDEEDDKEDKGEKEKKAVKALAEIRKGKPTYFFGGFCEFVDGDTLMSIKVEDLVNFISNSPIGKEKQLKRFLKYLVGSTVANFIVGLKDRHSFNILLTNKGEICHIDLNSVLGQEDVFHEKIGLVTYPSVFFPKTIQSFLKHERIKKYDWFIEEVKKAFNHLPKFHKFKKCCGNEFQARFIHDRIFKYNEHYIIRVLKDPGQQFQKKIRDMTYTFLKLGDSDISFKDDTRYFICEKIYKTNKKGFFRVTSNLSWHALPYVYCFENGICYFIENPSGSLYSYSIKEDSITKISGRNWMKAKGMIHNNGYIYILTDRLFKINVSDGYAKLIHTANWIVKIKHTVNVVHNMFLFTENYEKLFIFNPREKLAVYEVNKKNGLTFPQTKVLYFSEKTKSILFIDPYIWRYEIEKNRVEKITDTKFENVKAFSKLGNEFIGVLGNKLIRYDPEEDKIIPINVITDVDFKNTSLIF